MYRVVIPLPTVVGRIQLSCKFFEPIGSVSKRGDEVATAMPDRQGRHFNRVEVTSRGAIVI